MFATHKIVLRSPETVAWADAGLPHRRDRLPGLQGRAQGEPRRRCWRRSPSGGARSRPSPDASSAILDDGAVRAREAAGDDAAARARRAWGWDDDRAARDRRRRTASSWARSTDRSICCSTSCASTRSTSRTSRSSRSPRSTTPISTLMRELDLEIAGEYLVMAATLVHIKSRHAAPAGPDAAGGGRRRTIRAPSSTRQLLEYQRFKQAAENLQAIDSVRSLIWTRDGQRARRSSRGRSCSPSTCSTCIAAFKQAARSAWARTRKLQLRRDDVSVADKIAWLTDLLASARFGRSPRAAGRAAQPDRSGSRRSSRCSRWCGCR